MGEINVVPYIDVMLVLLIIFMITAPLLKETSRPPRTYRPRKAISCKRIPVKTAMTKR